MFQPERHSLKNDIALVLAVAAAGFKLANCRSVGTDDGACWHATLVHGRTKIVTVSDGGYGGGTESEYHSAGGKTSVTADLEKLFAIPEVTAVVRGHLLYSLDLKQEFDKVSDVDYADAKAAIENSIPAPTDESVEALIDKLAQATRFADKIKRATKTKLVVVFEGGDAKGEYYSYAAPDTPANRAGVQRLDNRPIAYFMNDLFASNGRSAA